MGLCKFPRELHNPGQQEEERTSEWWCISFVLAEGQILAFHCHVDISFFETRFHFMAQNSLFIHIVFKLTATLLL